MKKMIMAVLVCMIMLTSCQNANAGGNTDMALTEEVFRIDVDGHTLEAVFADNSSAEAFRELLAAGAVTVTMRDYGSFEKVGPLGTSLPRNDTYITTEPGDVILYQGNQITIYYDENSWSFTRLGKVRGVSSDELRSILGRGSITAVFHL